MPTSTAALRARSSARSTNSATSSSRDVISSNPAQVLELDRRSLGLFRIGLGFTALWSTIDRLNAFSFHYIDAGIFPARSPWTFWSLHLLSTNPIYQGALFGLILICAFGFMLGWQTRIMNMATWVLTLSLHHYRPDLLFGADRVMILLLFWSIFLPVGDRFSLDARGKTKNFAPVLSMAGAALLAQVAAIYFWAGIHKIQDPHWLSGDAVELALQAHPSGLGPWVVHSHTGTLALNYAVLALQLFGPILLFLSPRWRWRIALAFATFEIGLAVTMDLGFFPLICSVAWLSLVPTEIWDRTAVQKPREISPLQIYRIGAALIVVVVLAGLGRSEFEYGTAPSSAPFAWMTATGLTQDWRLFTPPPTERSGWKFVGVGRAAREIDLHSSSGARLRWAGLTRMLLSRPESRSGLAASICRRSDQLVSVKMFYVRSGASQMLGDYACN